MRQNGKGMRLIVQGLKARQHTVKCIVAITGRSPLTVWEHLYRKSPKTRCRITWKPCDGIQCQDPAGHGGGALNQNSIYGHGHRGKMYTSKQTKLWAQRTQEEKARAIAEAIKFEEECVHAVAQGDPYVDQCVCSRAGKSRFYK